MRKAPEEIIGRFCEFKDVDGKAAVAALDKAGYVIITKAEALQFRRMLAKTEGGAVGGTKTGRMQASKPNLAQAPR